VSDQEQLCRGLEESFLEEQGGAASEREAAEFVRRVKEARRVAYLRRERKERWDEGRIGGLRG
jgi:Modifier of rudimentary (Mod(r)) protein